jgi:hypothetical protein
MVMLAVIEFLIVAFIIPIVPEDDSFLSTPSLNVLVTQTISIVPTTAIPASMEQIPLTATTIPLTAGTQVVNCDPEKINITSPAAGGSISGVAEIQGTADIPNFGFYKFEFSTPAQPNWQAILAWTSPKRNDKLGQWDTSRLPEGLYLLRLVVTDNQGQAQPPCVIQVTIMKPPQ